MKKEDPMHSSVCPKILAVDDEEVIGYLIQRVVKHLGYGIEWVKDCETALGRISEENFDLILSDFKMPQMTGDQFYQKMDAMDKSLPKRLVFITGDTINSKTMKFLESKSLPYLSKPFDIKELQDLIVKMVGKKYNATLSG